MGWSAGGHLALLYAYKNPTQIDLVISEAGPTAFPASFQEIPSQLSYAVRVLLNDDESLLSDASPITYANNNSPFTVLVYSDDFDTFGKPGDGLLQYDQCIVLKEKLGNAYTEYSVNSHHGNFAKLIEDAQYLTVLKNEFYTLSQN